MNSFDELVLSAPLKQAVTEMGYVTPSPIQAQALPILLGEATDFIGLAATGTGKTAAFGLPILEKIEPAKPGVQALILCPTRELALQVSGQIDLLGKYKNIKSVPVYGGSSYGDQIRGLKAGASVVVGTPGRLVDHISRGTLQLGSVTTLILDEADEMISMGFKDDLELILKAVPRDTSNIWLFSATMSREVRKVADTYLRSPRYVQVNRTEVLSTTVEQIYYATRESNKPEVLCKIIDAAEDFYGIVFCQTKLLVMELTRYMNERGYKVDCLHGDMDQNARERTMLAFRNKRVRVLICTDVASRGLDVKDISHVVNYSIPREMDSYVHRIGRTARSGKAGIAISLVTPSHRGLITRIENVTKSKMVEGKLPTRKDVGMKKISKLLEKFKEQKNYARGIELLDSDWKELIADMTPQELVGRFVMLMFPDVFEDKNNIPVKFGDAAPQFPRRDSGGSYAARRSGPPRRDNDARGFDNDTAPGDRAPRPRPSADRGFGDRRPLAPRSFTPKPFTTPRRDHFAHGEPNGNRRPAPGEDLRKPEKSPWAPKRTTNARFASAHRKGPKPFGGKSTTRS